MVHQSPRKDNADITVVDLSLDGEDLPNTNWKILNFNNSEIDTLFSYVNSLSHFIYSFRDYINYKIRNLIRRFNKGKKLTNIDLLYKKGKRKIEK